MSSRIFIRCISRTPALLSKPVGSKNKTFDYSKISKDLDSDVVPPASGYDLLVKAIAKDRSQILDLLEAERVAELEKLEKKRIRKRKKSVLKEKSTDDVTGESAGETS